MALGQACNIRVGYWTGRGDPAMMRRAAWAAMLLGIAVAAVMTLGMALGRHAIISLYLNMSLPENTQAVSMALGLLLVGAAFQIPDAVQVITTGILRGQGDTAVPMVLAVISAGALVSPAGSTLPSVTAWGHRGCGAATGSAWWRYS